MGLSPAALLWTLPYHAPSFHHCLHSGFSPVGADVPVVTNEKSRNPLEPELADWLPLGPLAAKVASSAGGVLASSGTLNMPSPAPGPLSVAWKYRTRAPSEMIWHPSSTA